MNNINYDRPNVEIKTVFTVGFLSKYGFVPKIRSGEKGITIRKTRKDGRLPKIGQRMRMWADQRSKKGFPIFNNQSREPRCSGVWPINISYSHYVGFRVWTPFLSVFLNERAEKLKKLGGEPNTIYWLDGMTEEKNEEVECVKQFARLDGWDTPEQMLAFFQDSLPLDGFLYCWVKL